MNKSATSNKTRIRRVPIGLQRNQASSSATTTTTTTTIITPMSNIENIEPAAQQPPINNQDMRLSSLTTETNQTIVIEDIDKDGHDGLIDLTKDVVDSDIAVIHGKKILRK
jgi:hypothetical protein